MGAKVPDTGGSVSGFGDKAGGGGASIQIDTSEAGLVTITSSRNGIDSPPEYCRLPSDSSDKKKTPSQPYVKSELRDCEPEQLQITVGSEGAGGASVISVNISNQGVSCHFRSPITVTVRKPGDAPLRVNGNPGSVQVDVALPHGQAIGETPPWQWRNWCDPATDIEATASTVYGSETISSITLARCDGAPGSRSYLSSPGHADITVGR